MPSCKKGCCHCCRHHIVTDTAEVHALAQYVKRCFSQDQINQLRIRTQQWHQWDNTRPGRRPSAKVHEPIDLTGYIRCCPLLVDGVCTAYPARPIVCRTHLVSSHPRLCLAVHQPDVMGDTPAVLTSVRAVTAPFSTAIEDHIIKTGSDFSQSQMLLPHALAIEMEWDFAISL